MARYKHIDTSPRFLAVDLQRQLLPGTIEHALNHQLDHEIDLSHFDERFKNDLVGASAFPPAMDLPHFRRRLNAGGRLRPSGLGISTRRTGLGL